MQLTSLSTVAEKSMEFCHREEMQKRMAKRWWIFQVFSVMIWEYTIYVMQMREYTIQRHANA